MSEISHVSRVLNASEVIDLQELIEAQARDRARHQEARALLERYANYDDDHGPLREQVREWLTANPVV